MNGRMSMKTVRDINSRLFFSAGDAGERGVQREMKPWQYVVMEYARMGLTPPAEIPRLESIEDAEIWMCLDERVNRSLRMREPALAG